MTYFDILCFLNNFFIKVRLASLRHAPSVRGLPSPIGTLCASVRLVLFQTKVPVEQVNGTKDGKKEPLDKELELRVVINF